MFADPARVRLQIDDVDRLALRLGDLRQTRNRIRNAVVVLEGSATDDQVEAALAGEAANVEIPADGIAELARARRRRDRPCTLAIRIAAIAKTIEQPLVDRGILVAGEIEDVDGVVGARAERQEEHAVAA